MERRILITGGSRGVGAGIAEAAARRGWTTLLVSRDESAMKSLIATWQNGYPERAHRFLGLDLTSPEALRRLTAWLDEIGYPDTIVHNAAVGFFGPFDLTDLDKHEDTFTLGVRMTIGITHALLPRLRKAPGSYLVYLGSTSGRKPVPYMTVYSSTKAFIHHFAFALREELRGSASKVLLVVPGGVRTDFPRLAGLPDEVAAKGLSPVDVGEQIVRAIEEGKEGMLTIGSFKERHGGWLQRILPPSFWASRMRRVYEPMLGKSSHDIHA